MQICTSRSPSSRRIRWCLAGVLLTLSGVPLAGAEPLQSRTLEGTASMPETLWHADYPHPVFVAGERLLPPAARSVDRSLSNDVYAEHVESLVAGRQVGGCVPVDTLDGHYYDEEPEGRKGLASAVEQSDRVVVGRVTGWQAGVSFDRPGILVRLAVEEALKGELPGAELAVFFPTGDIRLGGRTLCARNSRWPDRPDVGDRALVMIDERTLRLDLPILPLAPSSVLTFDGDLVRRLPELYRRAQPQLRELTADELFARIRSWVAGEDGETQGGRR